MIDYKLIGNRIKTQRISQNLTQEHVAERVDITTVYLSKIENGHVKPAIDVLDAICDTIHIDISAVFSGTSAASDNYQCEKVVEILNSCKPEIKSIAVELLEKLSKI